MFLFLGSLPPFSHFLVVIFWYYFLLRKCLPSSLPLRPSPSFSSVPSVHVHTSQAKKRKGNDVQGRPPISPWELGKSLKIASERKGGEYTSRKDEREVSPVRLSCNGGGGSQVVVVVVIV